MEQLALFGRVLWSVTQVTRYIQKIFETDEYLSDIWVQGEVSNLSRPSSGHVYFTLKDASSSLRCVMWRSSVTRQGYIPRDGELVEATGNIGVYEAAGNYQLYVNLIRPAGEGALYQEFLRLKAKLETEGLFDQERKRPIPRLPTKIGIITSPTGAAIKDIINTLGRRFPLGEIFLAPTPVQGVDAPSGIIAALENLNEQIHPDVIILARGGGSIEDLWAFNVEEVARAIAASSSPVISGVGHETDFTIADFVSDLRAPTPTAAAELAVPNQWDLRQNLADLSVNAKRSIQSLFGQHQWRFEQIKHRLLLRSPQNRIFSHRQSVDEISRRANMRLLHQLALLRSKLNGLEMKLDTLNPHSVLQRGYAVVRFHNGAIVNSVQQVHKGDPLQVRVQDGDFDVLVER